MAGRAFTTSWYDPELQVLAKKARVADGVDAWEALLRHAGADWVMVRQARITRGLQAALARAGGEEVSNLSALQLWKLRDEHPGRALKQSSASLQVGFDASSVPPSAALVEAKANGPSRKLACFTLATPAHLTGGETICRQGEVLSVATSGGFGHTLGQSIVYGYLPLMILPIYVSLERLDRRLLEASADLGATPLSTSSCSVVRMPRSTNSTRSLPRSATGASTRRSRS